MIKLLGSIGLLFMLTGCSMNVQQAGEAYLKEQRLDEYSTYACYDYIDKKECPSKLMQTDINVFSLVPGYSRFCFGFAEHNTTIPVGMACYRRNLVK